MKTMAMIITRKNHPIAVGVLGSGFAGLPLEDVIGNIVVINQVGPTHSAGFPSASSKNVRLYNGWMTCEEFFTRYEFVFPKKYGYDKAMSIKKFREVREHVSTRKGKKGRQIVE